MSGDDRTQDKPGKKQEDEAWEWLGAAPLRTQDNGIIPFAVH